MQFRSIQWRKIALTGAGLLACVYAVSVLWYVPRTPDIGFRCGFAPVIKRVSLQEGHVFPQPEDTIEQIGNYTFQADNPHHLWAQVVMLRKLTDFRDKPLQELAKKGFSEVKTDEGKLVLEKIQDGQRLIVQEPDGEREVLVKFRKRATDFPTTIWCRIGTMPLEELVPSILWFFLKLGLFAVGVLVFWKRPEDSSAAQFFLLCIVTLGAYMGGYHWTRISTQPVLLLAFMVCGVMLPAVSLHFYLLFPRTKGLLQRHSWKMLLIIYGVPSLFLFVLLASYFHLRGLIHHSAPEAEIGNAWSMLRQEIGVYILLASVWYLASVVCLIHSYRTAADVTERKQVQWILFGAVAALVPIGITLYLIKWKLDDFGAEAATFPMFAASICFTLAFAISITRYRLMQLDQIISSGMVYFLISFLAGVVYYVVVFVGMWLGGVIHGKDLPSLREALPVVTTTFLLLLALDLIRGRIKKVLDRRFYRDKYQLDRTLRRMGQAIEQLVDPPTLARRWLQASAELLNVALGAVYLREGNPPLYRLAGCLGPTPPLVELSPGCPLVEFLKQSPGTLVARSRPAGIADAAQRQLRFLGGQVGFALAQDGQLLAFLVLGPKAAGSYNSEDLNLLAAFAQLTALAMASAEGHRTIETLSQELREKVEKISEQQRRILALQSQLTRQTSGNGPIAAETEKDGQEREPRPAVQWDGRHARPPVTGGIIGTSLPLRQLMDMVRKVSATQSAVLIRGESGTGKELLARALHDQSARSGKAFVKVHCAALSPGLLESELFGHVKGAFTGAHRDKVGRFELANGGTLFLDEIGDISLEVQIKLLRVLQEKTFERVGSSEPLQVNVRIITATHQNLEELIRQGRFRQDLYYRLKVIDIQVPPLRERREDIPELALHFLHFYAERCHKAVAQIDDDAMALLKSYPWPGNIRELENVIERAVVVTEGPTILPADLAPELARGFEEPSPLSSWGRVGLGDNNGSAAKGTSDGIRAEREDHDRRERERLVRALAAASGNKAEAARALGLARSTLISRLKKLGLQ
jgi:transcriptional regulator with GAF, ATPase, and Fis domain